MARAAARRDAAVDIAGLLDRAAPGIEASASTFRQIASVLARVGAIEEKRALPVPAAGTGDYAWWYEADPDESIFNQVFWRPA